MRNQILNVIRIFGDYFVWLLATIVCVCGSALVIEQGSRDLFSTNFVLLGPWYSSFSNYLTVVPLIIISANAYLESYPRAKPTLIGRTLLSPLGIGIGLVFLFVQIRAGFLNEKYLEGASFLALSGALYRLRGIPKEAFSV